MFRSFKRNTLVRRLWRNRVLHNEAPGTIENGAGGVGSAAGGSGGGGHHSNSSGGGGGIGGGVGGAFCCCSGGGSGESSSSSSNSNSSVGSDNYYHYNYNNGGATNNSGGGGVSAMVMVGCCCNSDGGGSSSSNGGHGGVCSCDPNVGCCGSGSGGHKLHQTQTQPPLQPIPPIPSTTQQPQKHHSHHSRHRHQYHQPQSQHNDFTHETDGIEPSFLEPHSTHDQQEPYSHNHHHQQQQQHKSNHQHNNHNNNNINHNNNGSSTSSSSSSSSSNSSSSSSSPSSSSSCPSPTPSMSPCSDETELKNVSHSMLKSLSEPQLNVLLQSVETKGGETTGCVLLPRGGELVLGQRSVPVHVFCCQLWRWPDIGAGTELKRLPCCTSGNDPYNVCCNPYHWSLLLTAESLPVSNCGLNTERVKVTTDRLMLARDPVSTETGLTPTHYRLSSSDGVNGTQNYWCSIAYWEMKERVGRLFRVQQPAINIFQLLPHGDGMCLDILQTESSQEAVRRTREKLGLGIILSKEGNGVWAYNRSSCPIFVNSPTLETPNCRSLVVRKVMPGYSIKIFDYKCSEQFEAIRDPHYLDGPYDPSSIRISFAKGWGPCYSRQFITSCPCWIEILLNVNR